VKEIGDSPASVSCIVLVFSNLIQAFACSVGSFTFGDLVGFAASCVVAKSFLKESRYKPHGTNNCVNL